ncbi:DUF523 domain-containing protein [bacterium]|nr:DUF523 domain-containing protein [bacterium]
MILVSACLLGARTRYDAGKLSVPDTLKKLIESGECIVPVCPEQLGGLATPRCRSAVHWKGDCPTVINEMGRDVTEEFLKGAAEALRIAETLGIRRAIFKSRSPSCGKDGVAARLLNEQGIEVDIIDAEKE